MLSIVAAVLAGVATWSLTEYGLHRGLGHQWTSNAFGREHVAHHGRGDYFAPTWKKLLAAGLAAAFLLGPAVLTAGPIVGASYVGGFVVSYLYYELLHRLLHVWQGVGPYARWARRHHFHHHFHDPGSNHGVTTPIWDIAFGTYAKPDVVRIPEKLRMRWLCDPTDGEVWEHLRGSYELRRGQRGAA